MSEHRRLGPVGRYVVVVTTVAASLCVLWWSGAVAPRARIPWTEGGATVQGRAYWEVREVENPGPLPVRVRAVAWTPTGLDRPQVRVSDRTGDDPLVALQTSMPFTPFELAPGERRSIVLGAWVACIPGAAEASPTSGGIAVTVEAPLGRPTVLDDPRRGSSTPTVPCP